MDARDQHSTIEILIQFVRGELPVGLLAEREREHLHALCPECAEAWEELTALMRREAAQTDYAAVFERALARAPEMERRLAADRGTAEEEVEELLGLDVEERAGKVQRAYRRFRTPAFVERMIAEARTWLRHDPKESLRLLAIAHGQVSKIDREPYPESLIHRARLRALAHRANVLRVMGKLREAEEAFAALRGLLRREPTEDLAVHGELASLEASLRLDQRRLPEAEALLERAAVFYRREGDEKGLAKVVMQRGMVLRIAGDAQRALPCLETAVEAIDAEADPELAISPRHSLVLCLVDLGRPEEARALLDRYRPLYHRLDLPLAPLWLAWAEGKVAASLGEDEVALDHLRTARDGYTERGLEFDAALVCLDLAEVHLSRAETAEVKRLAERMAAAFADRGVDAEAARAVALCHRAALAEAVTLELIARTRSALLRAQASQAR